MHDTTCTCDKCYHDKNYIDQKGNAYLNIDTSTVPIHSPRVKDTSAPRFLHPEIIELRKEVAQLQIQLNQAIDAAKMYQQQKKDVHNFLLKTQKQAAEYLIELCELKIALKKYRFVGLELEDAKEKSQEEGPGQVPENDQAQNKASYSDEEETETSDTEEEEIWW